MAFLELRIYPPVVALAAAMLMWVLSLPGPTVAVPGGARLVLALASLGAAFALLLIAFLTFRRHNTTFHPKHVSKAKVLLSSGVFAYSRNPMYLGMALVLLAWGIYLAAPAAVLGLAAFIIYIDRYQIRPEERALTALFGETYTAYCTRVRRWL